MKPLLAFLVLVLWLPVAAFAQDEEKGGLEGLLERSLSSDALDVTVEGLSGALSSTATIEKLTFADPTGPWMVIEGAELNWTRTALLRGRIEVADLAAARISLLRLPEREEPEPELPSAEAEPFSFSLPELPVSIEVEAIAAEEIVLEEAVLGERVVAVLQGGLRLAGGEGAINLNLRRTDVEGTALELGASFENSSEELVVLVDATGREGGLLSRRTGIPGAPALDLSIVGRGLLSDFEADVAFSTADSTRLGGIVRLLATAPQGTPETGVDRTIQAQLSGDVRALVTEDLRSFFGTETALDFETILRSSGAIDVPRLHLKTEQLNLRTAVSLADTKWPEKITLIAQLNSANDTPVRLPVPGAPTQISGAYINVSYDTAAGSVWSAVVTASDMLQGDVALETVDLRGAGRLTLPENGRSGAVSGRLSGGVSGLALPDASLQDAVGDELSFGTSFAWKQDEALEIAAAQVAAGDVDVSLDGLFDNLAEGVDFDGAMALNIPSLARFATLAGQSLGGAIALDLTGQATLLSGIFDLDIEGRGTNLSTGIADVDELLGGEARLVFSGARDTTGIAIRTAEVETAALAVNAQGSGNSEDANLALTARLDTLARFVPDLPGPVTFEGSVDRNTDGFVVDGTGTGPAGLRLGIDGTVAQDFSTADLGIRGAARLEMAGPFINPRTASGGIDYDLRINGPLGLDAMSGTMTLEGARVADPTIGFALEQLGGSAQLSNANVNLDFSGRGNRGGRVSLGGSLGLNGAQQAALDVDIDALRFAIQGLLETRIDGQVGLDGPLSGGGTISGVINLDETEIRIPDGAGGAGELDGLQHQGASARVRQTLDRAGLLDPPEASQSGGAAAPPFNLDLLINSPTQIFVRGFGLDAELGGSVEVQGTANAPRPVGEFELLRGRLSILGQRLTLTEGEILLTASVIPDIRFVSSVESDDVEVSAIISGPANEPEVSFESEPALPEEEALARLLFRSDVQSLSAIQALQLANSLIAVENGTGLGFFNSLREEAGLDDLDLTTDEEGQTSLRLGKYISDDVYTNVDINDEGETEVNLNIELTDSVTARGTAGTDNSAIGLFFERDY